MIDNTTLSGLTELFTGVASSMGRPSKSIKHNDVKRTVNLTVTIDQFGHDTLNLKIQTRNAYAPHWHGDEPTRERGKSKSRF